MKFTTTLLREIHADIEEALKAVGNKRGITFMLKDTRYSSEMFTVKVEARTGGADQDLKKQEWDRNAPAFFFKPEDYMKKVVVHGREYALVGIRPKGDKYLVVGRTPRGKDYKLCASDCLVWLGRQEEANLMRAREAAGRPEIDPELRAARRGQV